MLLIRRIALSLGIAILVATATAGPASAAHLVGPDQWFTGVINGHDGNTVTPIAIEMACYGPVQKGQTGHPMSGQTLAVHQLFPPSPSNGLGYTGNDTEIGVFFNAPPPAAASERARAAAAGRTRVFTRYDRTKSLPVAVTLPCSGTGTVWFVPIVVVPPSRSQAVPVAFVGQP